MHSEYVGSFGSKNAGTRFSDSEPAASVGFPVAAENKGRIVF